MPTTLLLDGPDLEALLLRARREGGPNARITRAEKVRRGGMMGFFAHEVFEVAVDVPDGYVPQPEPQPQPRQQPQAGAGAPEGDPFDAVVKAIAAMGTQDTPGTDLTALNAVGVSDSAARVRSAQRAATARAYSAGNVPGGDASDPASAGYATALLDRLENDGPDGDRSDAWTSDPATALVPAQRTPVPHELAADPVQASTQQPAFTALLDQLRRETLPPTPQDELTAQPEDAASAPDDGTGAPLSNGVADAGTPTAFAPLVPFEPQAAEIPTAELPAEPQSAEPQTSEPRTAEPRVAAATGGSQLRRPADPQLKADRQVLRALGVPSTLTRRLRAGDRFDAVLSMCRAIPDLEVDGDAPIVAVVGPSDAACFEAHRVAIDLATGSAPRPILTLPEQATDHRETVLEATRRLEHAVVAIATAGAGTDSDTDTGLARAKSDLRAVRAQVVVAVVDARLPIQQTQEWLAALGRVDAIAVEHAADVVDPARVLQLGLPVVRLDGVSMDPLGWTALLCARLSAAATDADA